MNQLIYRIKIAKHVRVRVQQFIYDLAIICTRHFVQPYGHKCSLLKSHEVVYFYIFKGVEIISLGTCLITTM